ncbi:PhnB protein [Isoptericola jiangsuensis]|uniref:PhnB protein n=1 Tax=Isoptericola jiangsuensis TaxID=548579 RepID=A0A2A9F1S9_9MICO|nr:VOC family protein [Isoptericola jiangsuensis]PFG44415.1 PhnB protein [Isoptericola jiangsuensis]
MVRLNPYLSFQGKAREALEFYRSFLGGEVEISTYGSMPGMTDDPAEQDLVMHGQLETDHGLTLMAADNPSSMPYVAPSSGVTVALTGGPDDLEYVQAAVTALSDGATDVMPFEKAPWGDHYGQLTDRYGVSWMFDVGPA